MSKHNRTKTPRGILQHGTIKQKQIFLKICEAQTRRLARSNYCEMFPEKMTYFTKASAEDMQRKRWIEDRVKLRVYPCPKCNGYHLSKPDENM